MSTSGTGALNAFGYVVVVWVVLWATRATLGDVRDRLRTPGATAVALWLCVAVPSLIGLADHAVYHALARQPNAILHHGELWRLLTGAVVQDGGIAGTAFNLVVLALIATAAIMAWAPARTVVLFVIGDLGFNALATFAFQSPGGGNSGATFFLATSIAGLLLLTHRSRREERTAAV